MSLREVMAECRRTGELTPLIDVIPYARWMGMEVDTSAGEVVTTMRYSDHLIGNSFLPALHGGTLGALLESAAIYKLLWEGATDLVPKTINFTVEYLRSAGAKDTHARGTFTRHGRRVANVRVVAWQDDPERPVAAANAHFLLVPVNEARRQAGE